MILRPKVRRKFTSSRHKQLVQQLTQAIELATNSVAADQRYALMATSGERVSSSGSPGTPLSASGNPASSTHDIEIFYRSVVPTSHNAGG